VLEVTAALNDPGGATSTWESPQFEPA